MTIYKIHEIGRAKYDGRSLYYKNLEDAIAEVERIWLGYQTKFEKMGDNRTKFFPYTIEESKDKRKLRFYNHEHYCFESIIKIEVNE